MVGAALALCQHVLVLLEHSIELFNAALFVMDVMDVVCSILVAMNKRCHMVHKCSHSLGTFMVEAHHEQFLLNVVSTHVRICSTVAVIDQIRTDLLSITKTRFRRIRMLSQDVGCLAFEQCLGECQVRKPLLVVEQCNCIWIVTQTAVLV